MKPPASLALLAFLLIAAPLASSVQLAGPFSDHMVLQARRPVPVWGTAAAGEKISVVFAGQTKSTVADASGRWRVTLDPLAYAPAHAPQVLIARGENDVRLTDVLIGEVWLCSGQSNMRYAMNRKADATGRPEETAPFADEIARAAHPLIRLLNVTGGTPADRKWGVCGPETVAAFSAPGYFFARALAPHLDAPIGLVDLGQGGAPIRAFIPRRDLEADAALGATLPAANVAGKADAVTGSIYEKDLRFFAPFAVRGMLWYQGEADVARAALYPKFIGALLTRWRGDLENAEMPVLIVQLPPYERRRADPPKKEIGVKWAEQREAQWHVAQTIPHTHLAIIADLGERLDIHPRRKPEVGTRLALLARSRVYGEKIPDSGPLFRASRIEGNMIILTFDHADAGLVATAGSLQDFTIAGDDGKFVPATAEIEGLDRVVVTLPPGSGAKFVRYAWQDYFTPTLFNGYGLPASPFRTDAFPLTSAAKP